MTELATTPETTTTVVSEIANRPLLVDEYPLQDETLTVNLWVREGDELATMRVTEETENDDEEAVTVEIDTYLTGSELFYLATAAGKALAALGDRANLIGLIQGLVDELGEMS